MALRQMRYEGDEILRKKSRVITEIDERTKTLLQDMADTMYAAGNGAGLAAVQVGVLRRAVVIDMGDGLIRMVNPELVESSGTQECVEGCLSFPNQWAKTTRPKKVTVRFLDENGQERVMTGEDNLAKCFCHELDHLDGILLPDRAQEWIR